MLVFSPASLPQIFDSLITNYRPRFKDATPANTLYMLARFAALTCDYTWLEDLLVGAADAIEETFFVGFMLSFQSWFSFNLHFRVVLKSFPT